MISGSYLLGSGFDIKYENSENSRRKTIVNKYCSLQKKSASHFTKSLLFVQITNRVYKIIRFGEHTVPDVITANGIYDTTTKNNDFWRVR